MHSLPWILRLVRGTIIEELSTSENNIIDGLERFHPAAGEWGCVHEGIFLAYNAFVDKRGNCPLLSTRASINIHQSIYLPITVLFRSAKHPSLEYTFVKDHVDQVRSINEVAYWYTTSNGNTVPRIVEARSPVIAEGGMSVNSGSKSDPKEKESNEILVVFLGLLFAHPVVEADGSINKLAPAEFIDKVNKIFGSATKAAEQAQMVMEIISSFAEEVSKEDGYLARAACFSHLT